MPSNLDTFFWVLAIAGTTTFALKTLLLTFSGHADGDGADVGHGDAGHHDGSAAHHGSNWAFQFFTIQSLAVFAMGAGWMGLAAEEHFARSDAEALAAATLFGVALAALMIKVMSKLRRLESSGTLDAKNAVGGTGTVYLTVPQDGAGQIEIVLQGRLVTWDAVSPAGAVPTGARVRVEAVDEAGRLVVSPV